MSEKPILFCTEMVKAILEDRKTMTRRIFKNLMKKYVGYRNRCAELLDDSREPLSEKEFYEVYSPYSKGDVLWVREAFMAMPRNKLLTLPPSVGEDGWWTHGDIDYCYRADDTSNNPDDKWHPSIFMPREASRIFLEVTSVKVEHLRDISESDAQREGVEKFPLFELKQIPQELFLPGGMYGKGMIPQTSYKAGFYKTWEQLNTKRGYGWDKNPWVWVIQFEMVKP